MSRKLPMPTSVEVPFGRVAGEKWSRLSNRQLGREVKVAGAPPERNCPGPKTADCGAVDAAVTLTVKVVFREEGFVLVPVTVTTYDPGVVLAGTARVMAVEPLVVSEVGENPAVILEAGATE